MNGKWRVFPVMLSSHMHSLPTLSISFTKVVHLFIIIDELKLTHSYHPKSTVLHYGSLLVLCLLGALTNV